MPTLSFGKTTGLTVPRSVAKADCFSVLETVPNYIVPTARQANEVNRLMKLARRLEASGVEKDAIGESRGFLVEKLTAALSEASRQKAFTDSLVSGGKLRLVIRTRQADGEEIEEEQLISTSPEDIERYFDDVSRRLREGLAAAYVKRRILEGVSFTNAKLELIALSAYRSLAELLTSEAAARARNLLAHHAGEIVKLDSEEREAFDEIRGLSGEPEVTTMAVPKSLLVTDSESMLRDHVYANEDGLFPVKLNNWETSLLEEEMARADFFAWLRNIDRKRWALRIPYETSGEIRPFYPDFLLFRRRPDASVAVDIIDPHLTKLEDASGKAAGLAKFAAKHGHSFDRIQLVHVEKGKIRRLELRDHDLPNRLLHPSFGRCSVYVFGLAYGR